MVSKELQYRQEKVIRDFLPVSGRIRRATYLEEGLLVVQDLLDSVR
jgi:hypothetical protein